MRSLIKESSVDTTQCGVVVGVVLVLIFLGISLLHGKTPDLRKIIEILLDGVLISGGGRLLIEGMRSKTKEMGVFSELRITIVLGAVAMLYVATSSLIKVVSP